jgi:hypothetical protein
VSKVTIQQKLQSPLMRQGLSSSFEKARVSPRPVEQFTLL